MPVVGQLLCRVFASLADVMCAVLPVAEFFAALPDGSDATLMMVNGRVSPRHVSAAPNSCVCAAGGACTNRSAVCIQVLMLTSSAMHAGVA
jgi:hypothetical protein